MRSFVLVTALLALSLCSVRAQVAVNDPDVDIGVAHAAFAQNGGPVIAIDSGHNNYHTLDGRYEPLARLLRNDGFRVVDSKVLFTSEGLSAVKVLVISNALSPMQAKNWNATPASAFSKREIDTLKAWVAKGGSLLLIADHHPFAASAHDLAQSFGFSFEDGVVARDPLDGRPDIFTIVDKSLHDDVITRGRNTSERITSLRTFTGSAFRAPPTARPVIVFPSGFMIHQCGLPCPAEVPERDATGYLQGAVESFGKGRVAMFGEAAMFSAQVIDYKPPFHFGFGAEGAEQNRQFILNLARWLAGVLPE